MVRVFSEPAVSAPAPSMKVGPDALVTVGGQASALAEAAGRETLSLTSGGHASAEAVAAGRLIGGSLSDGGQASAVAVAAGTDTSSLTAGVRACAVAVAAGRDTLSPTSGGQ